MNKKAIIIIIMALFAAGAASPGCGRKPSPDDKILAKVSNKFVTLGDFKKRLSKLPPYYRSIADRNKKRFLDDTVIEMMFYEEAIRRSIDRERETREIMEEAKKKILIAKLIKEEVEDKIDIDDAEMRQYYESHKDDFKSPALWRASHILVQTEGEAKALLEAISARRADFDELARTKSIDATSVRAGDVGYFRQGQVVPEFENACMSLNVGEVSGIVRTQFGYHIIKLTGKKEPEIEPYEKVRSSIENELKKAKRNELFNKLVRDLKNKYNVEIEEDVFKTLGSLDAKTEMEKVEAK